MTQREKLIELLPEAVGKCKGSQGSDNGWGEIADYLIANGVIVLPCKVGDTVYVIDELLIECQEATVTKIEINKFTDPQIWLEYEYYSLFGHCRPKTRIDLFAKSCFFTRKEAERALEDMKRL